MQTRRFILPTAARIVEIRQENYRTKTFVLDVAAEAVPGQFVMLWLPAFDEKPFSLVSADPVALMVASVGPFTRLLHEKRVGDRVWLRGPFGTGFEPPSRRSRPALIGGGYGVAPLYWLAASLDGATSSVTTIIGAATADDLLYLARFESLQSMQGVTSYRTLCTTEDGSHGLSGRVTDALLPLIEAGEVDAIYGCGPHGMLSALAAAAKRFALPCQLSWEAYMRCAIGLCGSCEHDGKVLCLDGPVLRWQP
jgi:dihydroorotate dehydrogenase electron transfer subunit